MNLNKNSDVETNEMAMTNICTPHQQTIEILRQLYHHNIDKKCNQNECKQ